MNGAPPGAAVLARLAEAGAALERLGQTLGLGQHFLAGESRDRLAYEGPVDPAALAGLPAAAGYLASLGGALSAAIKIGDMRVLEIRPATTVAEVTAAQADLDGQSGRLDLNVDKDRLRQDLGLVSAYADVALFLSPEALLRELARPLPEVATDLLRWSADDRKLIFFVAGCPLLLSGEHLAIVGGWAPPGWAAALPPQPPSAVRIVSLRQQAFQSATAPGTVNWLRFELAGLTPVHLALDAALAAGTQGVVGGAIWRSLMRVQGLLGIGYTATQVAAPHPPAVAAAGDGGPPGDWVATYAAEGKVARLSWTDDEPAAVGATGDLMADGARILGDLAQWGYAGESGSTDRLTVVRDVIARNLMGNDPRDNYRILVRQAAAYRDRVHSSWQAFIDGRLDVYFGRVRELEQVVETTLKTAGEQLDGLTKALTDSALAAVGVIVASFLAAVFKDKFDPVVYRLGVTAYAIYLALFPGIIGLTASCQRFTALARTYRERRQAFSDRLSDAEVNRVIGDAFARMQRRYWTWFAVAALVYTVLTGLLWWSRSGVPRLLASPAAAGAAHVPTP